MHSPKPPSMTLSERCALRLAARQQLGLARSLPGPTSGVDFLSNDYLGLARRALAEPQSLSHAGATGSRLLSGDSLHAQRLEAFLAGFHQAPAALLYGSGYMANLGILQALCERGDYVFYDQFCHASIREGLRLSFATCYSFAHNDCADLERLLQRCPITGAQGEGRMRWIVLESLYSMDGDCAPLAQLCALAERYSAQVIVDEAHATGVFGERGQGLVQALGLTDRVAIRMHSFGKAVGYHGAAVLAAREVIEMLLNFSRAFIYTTALPPSACQIIQDAYQQLSVATEQRAALARLVGHFQAEVGKDAPLRAIVPPREGPIQIVLCPGNQRAALLAQRLRQRGFAVRAVLSPTVPKGSERLRLVLHSFNTTAEVSSLLTALSELYSACEDTPDAAN
jgi:8-amino-7-oxononanoate synthase